MVTKHLRPSGKLRTKKTIRKMTPLARKCAHLAKEANSLGKRLMYLSAALQEAEMLAGATDRALNARIEQAEHPRHTLPPERDPVLGPELPNGEGIPDPHMTGYHANSLSDPRD
jgi:hypothetical protein